MADWYCDASLAQAAYADYSPTPVAAGTVPTKPEDGNGKAAGVATMATRVITFSGLPTASQAITVAGVTFTAVASGATGNQFNIGADASATAANLRAAINASTTSVVNPTMASCPLRNAVNATNSGATITLYTRIAGSEWNSITETSTLSNVTNNQWSGGADGAWGYFFNPAAIAWPSSVSAGTYGGFPGNYLGAPAAGDTIHIRSKRSGSDVKITWPSSGLTVTSRAVGTPAAPLVFLVDAGIKWSGDSGVFTLSADASQTANRRLQVPTTTGLKQIWAGTKLGATARSWRHELTGSWAIGNYTYVVGGNVSGAANFIDVEAHEVVGAAGAAPNNVNNAHRLFQFSSPFAGSLPRDLPSMVVRSTYFRSQGQASPFAGSVSASSAASLLAIDCINDHTGCTVASSEAVLSINQVGGVAGNTRFEAVGCQFLGFPAAANLSGFQGFSGRIVTALLRDCVAPNIKMFGGVANGGLIGTAENLSDANADVLRSIRVVSTVGSRPSIFESARWAWGWFDSAAPVVSSSLLPDGVTPFSLRCAVTTESGNVGPGAPVRFPRLGKINSLADGTRTATLRLLVDNNIRTALGSRDPNNAEMWVEINYVGTDGLPKTVSSRVAFGATPSALAAGTGGDWSATSYDVNGVSHSFTPFKIDLSCPNMEGGSECGLHFHMGCQSSSVDDLVFLDPEWSLA